MINVRRLTVISHDLIATPIAILAAYFLRLGLDGMALYSRDIVGTVLILTPIAGLTYWLFGLYRGVWRFASIPDLVNIVKAVTALALVMAVLDFASRGQILVPRTVPAIYWLVQIMALAGPRLFYRAMRDRRQVSRAERHGYRIPVLIAGTGEDADTIIRRLQASQIEPMQPIGLLTHKPQHVGERLRGVPVLGLYANLETVVEHLRQRGTVPRRLVFTREAMNRGDLDDLLGAARQLGLTAVRPEGGYGDLGEDRSDEIRLAPLAIEDLLQRETRDLDLSAIKTMIEGRRVVVTGGGGSIGSEMCRQIAAMAPSRLLVLDLSEHALYEVGRSIAQAARGVATDLSLGDVRDAEGLKRRFAAFAPDLVFHAAALKHVSIVEEHAVEAAHTNTLGTRNVADAALACNALAVVAISTDKAVNPVSILGATKRATEIYCAALDEKSRGMGQRTRFLSVRFGNVLGSSGSVVPLFREQLQRGGPLTVTHPEMERYFMTISEAVTLVLMASALGTRDGAADASSFVLDMGKPIRIVDLARQMIRLAGLEPEADIPIVFTGPKPGERLKESLENPGETLQKTAVDGVLVAAGRRDATGNVEKAIAQLDAAVRAHDADQVRAALGAIVPEYKEVLAAGLPQVAE